MSEELVDGVQGIRLNGIVSTEYDELWYLRRLQTAWGASACTIAVWQLAL
jgi:hypothetical protein